MHSSLFEQAKNHTSIFYRTACELIYFFKHRISNLMLEHSMQVNLFYQCQYQQKSNEAFLDAVMQPNAVYQSHDIEILCGACNAN